jgi:hypothetical protein
MQPNRPLPSRGQGSGRLRLMVRRTTTSSGYANFDVRQTFLKEQHRYRLYGRMPLTADSRNRSWAAGTGCIARRAEPRGYLRLCLSTIPREGPRLVATQTPEGSSPSITQRSVDRRAIHGPQRDGRRGQGRGAILAVLEECHVLFSVPSHPR